MLYSALILGLLSSLHCIGMCGPIAMMLPVNRTNETKKAIQILLYHAGRLSAYGTLGLVFGIIGKGLYLAGLQQQLSIIAGIVMIIIVMLPEKKVNQYNLSRPVNRILFKIRNHLGIQLRNKNNKAFYMTGLLNGFLPCGLVYAALFGAIAMQNEVTGFLYMILYGAGTIPLMSAIVYMSGMMNDPLRNKLTKIIPYTAVFIGMLFIVRGLGLGIPYISPDTLSLSVMAQPNCK